MDKKRASKLRGDSRSAPSSGRSAGLSVPKKALFSLLTVAAFLLVLEVSLTAFGVRPILYDDDPYVGFSSRVPLFVSEAGPDGRTHMVTAKNKLDFFNLQKFPRDKPSRTYRIFCVGGSTTYGRPYDDTTSFCGWLRELLAVADDSRTWEVVNAGGISYASYRVAMVMEELAGYEPDLFIIYSGHNEFLERRTYASMLETPSPLRGLEALLSTTRTYAAVHRLIRGSGQRPSESEPKRDPLPGEVEALLDRSVGPDAYTRDDALQEQVFAHYRFNLHRMVGIARSAGARVILVTPASNLRDCSPFKSEQRAGIRDTELERWQTLVQRAAEAQAAGQFAAALRALDEAAAIDDRVASLHYQRGHVLLALERHAEAKAALQRARDEDVCPLRVLTPMLKIVREVATELDVPCVDAVALVEARSEHGIPGDNLFLDHVHPTVEGHRLVALSMLEAMVSAGILSLSSLWSEELVGEVTRRVEGRIDRPLQGAGLRNLAKVLGWAGKLEEADKLALRSVELIPDDANARYLAAVASERRRDIDQARSHYERALRIDPDYADAHSGLGGVLLGLGDPAGAAVHYERALGLDPQLAGAHSGLGAVCAARGDLAGAAVHYERALRIDPDFAEAHNGLGGVFERRGDHARASAHYEQALRIQPDLAAAHNNLGGVLAREGKLLEAQGHFERALRIQPDFAAVHNNLGTLLGKQGDLARATFHYERAVRIKPDFAEAHNNLGLVLASQGRLVDAVAHYESALRIQPGFVAARNNLRRARVQLQKSAPSPSPASRPE